MEHNKQPLFALEGDGITITPPQKNILELDSKPGYKKTSQEKPSKMSNVVHTGAAVQKSKQLFKGFLAKRRHSRLEKQDQEKQDQSAFAGRTSPGKLLNKTKFK